MFCKPVNLCFLAPDKVGCSAGSVRAPEDVKRSMSLLWKTGGIS